jgi:hypothetical protein
MKNLFFLFLFISMSSFAQKYSGKYYNEKTRVGYNVLFLIRPDSSISLTFETINPSLKKNERKKNDVYNPVLYYDFHGLISKTNDSSFYLNTKEIFSFTLHDSPECNDIENRKLHTDTMEIGFDSVKTFLTKRIYASYGNVQDSFCITVPNHYDFGFPYALNDSNHVIPLRTIYFPVDTFQFKKSGKMEIDIGYVNPVTDLPVKFSVPFGSYPFCQGDIFATFNLVIKDNLIYFYNNDCPFAFDRNGTFFLTEIK